MSKIKNLSAVFGSLGGLVAGVLATLQFLAPSTIETPQDLISALGKIEAAIQENGLTADQATAGDLATAVDNFALKVASQTRNADGDLLFVPRSFAGLHRYEDGQVFDFFAPDGTSKLFRVDVSGFGFGFMIDGEYGYRAEAGEHFDVEFEQSSCKFEVIEWSRKKIPYGVVRVTCS